MALTGAQLQHVLSSVGAAGGQVASYDQLAAGANDALNRLKKANGGSLSVDQAAGFLASLAMEGAYFHTTTEYGSGQSYAPYIGRTFEQLTWKSNYAAFGAWARSQGLVSDPNLFVKNPAQLGALTWAWLGGVYYWTANRSWGTYSNMLDVAATGSILAISRAINAGTPNTSITPYGMSARTTMWNAFRALGGAILPGASSSSSGSSAPAPHATPAGAIPGTAAMVLKAANNLWNKYKGHVYCYAWPGLRTLGDRASSEYWCADFVRLAFRQGTGYDWKNYTAGRSGPAYCPALLNGMRADRYWTEVSYHNAQGGDVVLFMHGGTAYHVGLVEYGPSSSSAHDMRTIEGDTSTPGLAQSMSSGGTLAKKTRDDRYYTMHIFRPTYWTAAASTDSSGNQTNDDSQDASSADVSEQLDVDSIEAGYDPGITTNPIDDLKVRPSFWAGMAESTQRTCKASLWLDGQVAIEQLPIVLSDSKITVDSGQPVRRKASVKLVLDEYQGTYRDLMQALEYPGMRLRIDAGFGWGGETVPVFDGLWDDPKFDGNIVTNECPDAMAAVSMAGHTKIYCTDQSLTYVESIRGIIGGGDEGAKVIDLTGNTDKVPYVIWDMGASSRVDAAMGLAAAIGAELFKSPAPGYYVLRPRLAADTAPKWNIDEGGALVSLSKQVSWSKVKNGVVVTSERSDSARMVGEWHDESPTSPTRWGGPFGTRPAFLTTSLIGPDRDALETAARSICERLIGGRIDVEWTQLVNPLLESGDPISITQRGRTYQAVLDSFEIPLGSQRTTPGKARSLSIEGLT